MNNQNNITIIKKLYDEFLKGNISGVLEIVANDVEWITPSGNELSVPSICRGRNEVANFFNKLGEHYEFNDFQVKEYVTNGDRVIAIGYFEGISKLTNKKFVSDWVMDWTIKNGQVKNYKSYFDTYNFYKVEKPDKDNFNTIETVLAAFEAFGTGNEEKTNLYLTNNFSFEGPVPQPLNKEQYANFLKACIKGIPDWKFNISNIKVNGNRVDITVKISGTQTGVLELPLPGLKAIQPTNKSFEIAQEVVQCTVVNNKIEKIYVPNIPGGGIPGILQQLGHPLPKM